jgi:hypothetical protein
MQSQLLPLRSIRTTVLSGTEAGVANRKTAMQQLAIVVSEELIFAQGATPGTSVS